MIFLKAGIKMVGSIGDYCYVLSMIEHYVNL